MSSFSNITYEAPGTTEHTRYEKIHNLCFTQAKIGSKIVAEEIAFLITKAKKKVGFFMCCNFETLQIKSFFTIFS